MLPYGRQSIDETDIAAVVEALRSDWLTTGPRVAQFESAFARAVGAREAVAVSSGTAALHAALAALDVGPGDEVIVPAITFAASSNAAVYLGATPVFADVEPDTLLVDPRCVAALVGSRTRAIVAVDYAGQPCDYTELRRVAGRLPLVADACHALGASDGGRPVGTLADLSTFSLHPVKHVTSGEGGMITTESPELAAKMRTFRNHGITTDHRQREQAGLWEYDMAGLGYNYRLTDIQCALGQSQLARLTGWIARRRAIAARYDSALTALPGVQALRTRGGAVHAYHLYVVRLDPERIGRDRAAVFRELRALGIGVNVHYRPVHLHSFYRRRFGYGPGLCPVAEREYERILTLPLFPAMTDGDVEDVIGALHEVCDA
jgi:perosamine synthetase